MTSYDGLIFDKDGVLLDSGLNNFRWMDKARAKKAQERGIELTLEDSVQIIKTSDPEKIEETMERVGMSWKDLQEIENSVQQAKIEMIKQGIIWLFPEAKDTLEDIDMPMTLATNAPKKVTSFTLTNFEIDNHFKSVKSTSISSVKDYFRRKKPKPIMLEEIMDENSFENPLMIGDTSTDINAAINAGIDSAHVLNYSDKAYGKADYEINDLSQIKNIV